MIQAPALGASLAKRNLCQERENPYFDIKKARLFQNLIFSQFMTLSRNDGISTAVRHCNDR